MVIANSCAGAFCYQNKKDRHYQYDNPFVSCTIFAKDWNLLLENFEKINFLNIKVENGIFPLNQEQHNYIILDNIVQIWFIHYPTIDRVRERWLDRAQRLIEFIQNNKDWKNKILFVSSSYIVDNEYGLIKTATYFNRYKQIIDTFGNEDLYKKLKSQSRISKNTKLYNRGDRSFRYLSNFILTFYKHFVTNEFK